MDSASVDDGWLDKPWMYSEPKSSELLANWKETWVKYFLRFAENKNIYLVNVADLHREAPFNRFDGDTFQTLLNSLMQTGYGKWWNKKSGLLRIYWRSLDAWADYIYNLTKEQKTRVINGIQGLTDLEPSLASMPEKEKLQVLKILVDKKFARWIKKKDCTLRINQ
ncbi:MAG: vacuolar protein-sorting-associated protein 25 [Candidatus Bathyarchaeota archaeon]|nr:vacuolar protein-sorting-associated protein 25 [Candidatus Bathyarchaeota archaeon]